MTHHLARIAEAAARRPGPTLAIAAIAAAGCIVLAALALGLNSDENDLFAADIELAERRARFYDALPALADPVIVVIETAHGGVPAALLDAAADALVARVSADAARFRAVYGWPDEAFRARFGALYLDRSDLVATLDRVVRAQPLLGGLAREPGLVGLLGSLTRFLRVDGDAASRAGGDDALALLAPSLAAVSGAIGAWERDVPGDVDWGALVTPPAVAAHGARRILFVLPVVDYTSLDPAGPAIAALRDIVGALPGLASGRISVRLTGVPVLAHEDGEHVAAQAGLAGAASLLLVLAVLARGLGSWRLLGAVAATLLVALGWTAGLATLLVGHLNVISVAFGVLCIGLGVDFAIHFALRFVEARAAPGAAAAAVATAARATGGALTLCAVTTAVGFLAFVPTDFDAMAELGVIMAAGMAASLLATFTVLPALLAGVDAPPRTARPVLAQLAARIVDPGPRAVLVVFAALTVAAAALLPQLRFDASPLGVRDPGAASVQVLRALLGDGDGVTWNMNVLAPAATADRVAASLESLPAVAAVRRGADYLPQEQAAKLELIDDAALTVMPAAAPRVLSESTPAQLRRALGALADAIDERSLADAPAPVPDGGLAAAARRAARALAVMGASDARDAARDLESRIAGSLERELAALDALFTAERLALDDLPPGLRPLAVTADGRERLEVLPAGDLTERRALADFVDQVLAVAPGAFGEALAIDRLGALVVEAFALASAACLLAVVGLVFLVHRSARVTALVATPLLAACVLTLGACVALGIELNFANLIVLPLLLGIGVDTSIHLVHRSLGAPGARTLLESHTARAVILSGLTTAASFGSLALSRHLGLASLGQLLCLGLACVMACNLLLLPALLRVVPAARRANA